MNYSAIYLKDSNWEPLSRSLDLLRDKNTYEVNNPINVDVYLAYLAVLSWKIFGYHQFP